MRRSNVIVRGRVLQATRPAHPELGAYPLLTEVAVEKVHKGEGVPQVVTVLGLDDHAVRYRAGQRALFFLHGGRGREFQADQQKGEEIFVGAGEEQAWDDYLVTAVRVAGRPVQPWQDPEYRAAVRRALAAPAPALRAHALRRMALRLAGDRADAEDVAAVLRAFRVRRLPDRARLALLRAVLHHLSPSDLAPLAAEGGETPLVRGSLVEAWAERAAARGTPAEQRAVREAALAGLGDGEPFVRVHAAAALARLGDPAGVAVLRDAIADREAYAKRVAIRGLGLLARTGNPDVLEILADARGRETDPRAQRWLGQALAAAPSPAAPAKPRGGRAALWIGFGVAGAALLAGLVAWIRWARRKRSTG